jgi:hypothetical protein
MLKSNVTSSSMLRFTINFVLCCVGDNGDLPVDHLEIPLYFQGMLAINCSNVWAVSKFLRISVLTDSDKLVVVPFYRVRNEMSPSKRNTEVRHYTLFVSQSVPFLSQAVPFNLFPSLLHESGTQMLAILHGNDGYFRKIVS